MQVYPSGVNLAMGSTDFPLTYSHEISLTHSNEQVNDGPEPHLFELLYKLQSTTCMLPVTRSVV